VEPAGLAFDVERPQPAGRPWPPRPASWDDVYRAERDGLVRLAYLMTGSQAVAEDLVQDCFVRVMAKIGPDANPGPYLRRSVVNACYSFHRRAWREVTLGDRDIEGRGQANADVEMWDALKGLPPRRRTVLVMRFYLDMSDADVAATLGCRVGTVKSTTSRALAELRKRIER
jgi:RNA polymerase sigma factor (sigma-70 family)